MSKKTRNFASRLPKLYCSPKPQTLRHSQDPFSKLEQCTSKSPRLKPMCHNQRRFHMNKLISRGSLRKQVQKSNARVASVASMEGILKIPVHSPSRKQASRRFQLHGSMEDGVHVKSEVSFGPVDFEQPNLFFN